MDDLHGSENRGVVLARGQGGEDIPVIEYGKSKYDIPSKAYVSGVDYESRIEQLNKEFEKLQEKHRRLAGRYATAYTHRQAEPANVAYGFFLDDDTKCKRDSMTTAQIRLSHSNPNANTNPSNPAAEQPTGTREEGQERGGEEEKRKEDNQKDTLVEDTDPFGKAQGDMKIENSIMSGKGEGMSAAIREAEAKAAKYDFETQFMHALFNKLDSNKDGIITREEFLRNAKGSAGALIAQVEADATRKKRRQKAAKAIQASAEASESQKENIIEEDKAISIIGKVKRLISESRLAKDPEDTGKPSSDVKGLISSAEEQNHTGGGKKRRKGKKKGLSKRSRHRQIHNDPLVALAMRSAEKGDSISRIYSELTRIRRAYPLDEPETRISRAVKIAESKSPKDNSSDAKFLERKLKRISESYDVPHRPFGVRPDRFDGDNWESKRPEWERIPAKKPKKSKTPGSKTL
ncbi:hypothetical protein AAMO2058_000310900, partial [Amorphochlora amoebiformis]